MDFKIDTKDTFTTITPPGGVLNAKLADELRGVCAELRQKGSKNFIIDLGEITGADTGVLKALREMHEACYSSEASLVFTNLAPSVADRIKTNEGGQELNIAPQMQEAIDIINMEIIERELFSEE